MAEREGEDLEAKLAKIDAAVSELLDLWQEGSERRDELGRELVEERAKNLELQRRIVPSEKELAAANTRIAELEARLAETERARAEAERSFASATERLGALESAAARGREREQARVALLEAQVADLTADFAEREHQAKELQQALQHERGLRRQGEAERDHLRQLAGFLQKSRWRRIGKAIGLVKTPEWERSLGE
jgi:chromosome segregation ATPase